MSVQINSVFNFSEEIQKCDQISNLKATASGVTSGALTLTWTNPEDNKFKGVEIFYKKESTPLKYGDGIKCYDSNDGSVTTKLDLTNFDIGTTYHFRAFAYTYKNATRIYTEKEDGAIATVVLSLLKEKVIITSSQIWTVPDGVNQIDVFLVGGGAGSFSNGGGYNGEMSGAGGSGYTKTIKKINVTPGSNHNIIIGAGGSGNSAGGSTSFDSHIAQGGLPGQTDVEFRGLNGGNGGSAGGRSGERKPAENGASNGGNTTGAFGQGTSTKEFEESNGTLYAGGGGGAYIHANASKNSVPGLGGAGGGGKGAVCVLTSAYSTSFTHTPGQNGSVNTGGGAGSAGVYMLNGFYETCPNTSGGSGICIIRWGY